MNQNELYHYGILGMKWGVRKGNNKSAKLSRKVSLFDDPKEAKRQVEANRKEAADRIRFYGGKNVATNYIKAEAKYRTSTERAKGIAKSVLYGAGGVAGGFVALASGGAEVAAIGVLAAGGVGAAHAAYTTAKAITAIKDHAREQVAYTKDSEYGADMVVANKQNKDYVIDPKHK